MHTHKQNNENTVNKTNTTTKQNNTKHIKTNNVKNTYNKQNTSTDKPNTHRIKQNNNKHINTKKTNKHKNKNTHQIACVSPNTYISNNNTITYSQQQNHKTHSEYISIMNIRIINTTKAHTQKQNKTILINTTYTTITHNTHPQHNQNTNTQPTTTYLKH